MGTHGQGETGGVVLWELSEILYLLPEQLMERIDRERQHVNLFVKTHKKSLGGGGGGELCTRNNQNLCLLMIS